MNHFSQKTPSQPEGKVRIWFHKAWKQPLPTWKHLKPQELTAIQAWVRPHPLRRILLASFTVAPVLSHAFHFLYLNKSCFVLTPTCPWNFSWVSQEPRGCLTHKGAGPDQTRLCQGRADNSTVLLFSFYKWRNWITKKWFSPRKTHHHVFLIYTSLLHYFTSDASCVGLPHIKQLGIL